MNLPATDDPPFDLTPIIMVDVDGMTAEQAAEIEDLRQAIMGAFHPEYVKVDDVEVRTDDQLSLAGYLRTAPIYFEHRTYRGEEVLGAEPL